MKFRIYTAVTAAVLIGLIACSDEPGDDNDPTNVENINNIPQNPDNNDIPDPSIATDLPNALGLEGHDLLPWPADQYVRTDDGQPYVEVAEDLLPAAITPLIIEGSGVSRVTPMVTRLPGGVDPRTLPDPDDWGATLEDDSPVKVAVFDDDGEFELWPVMAEIDATETNPDEATLLLRPHRPFPGGARVAVILTTELRSFGCYVDDYPDQFDEPDEFDCYDHGPHQALDRIASRLPADRAEQAWLGEPIEALEYFGGSLHLSNNDVAQAWTFTVRDKAEVVDPLIAMQEISASADASSYQLEEIEYEEDRALVYGELEVPWFLDEEDRLVVDADGTPVVQQTRDVPFLVTIPSTVSEPRPTVLFGHGFFSSIEESTWNNLFHGLERWQMPAVTTRFYGFSEEDLVDTVEALGADTLDGMIGVIDLQRQSQANFSVVHNMLRDHLAQELTVDFGDGEFHPLDASNIPYMGISNGGTQGLVIMSTSPVVERGALVVPGGGWAHMLQRATQWDGLGLLFRNRYDDNDELQIAMAMLQQVFDPADSLNYVEHLVEDRLPGLPEAPPILIVEAVNDSQVANLVTRWVVGTAQVPVITPNVAEVWGTPTVDASAPEGAPGGVGFESYDLGVPDNPPGNVAPDENGVHGDVRRLDAYREQMGIFLEDGRVIRTCDGPCDPE